MTLAANPLMAVTEDDRRPLWLMGARLDIIVDGDQTGGAYAVAEDRSPPGFGPPPHVHEREDEAFYVIEGEYLFGGPNGEVHARPGTFVHAPRRHLHWWRNVGDGPGRHLEIYTPAGLEKMFLEVGEPIREAGSEPPAPNPRRLLEAAPRYGVTFHLPDRPPQ